MEQKQPLDGRRGQRRQKRAGIVVENPDIAEGVLVDMAQQRGDAVDEGFTADEADLRMGGGLPGQMLAGAETDFQPVGLARRVEQCRQIDRAGFRHSDQQLRQQGFDQPGPALAQRAAAAAAVEPRIGSVAGRRRVLAEARARPRRPL